MTFRHAFFLLLLLAGAGLLAAGLRGYASAWAPAQADPARAIAAGRAAMRALPLAALGVLLLTAGAVGWWRDRAG